MNVYLVSNNLVVDNINYNTQENILEKRITRVLSIDGEKQAVKLVKTMDIDVIYSSSYASALGTAKYISDCKGLTININSYLNDALIGDLGSRNIHMLRFMQEKDFDFKFNHGESLNEVSNRMNLVINRIIKENFGKNIVIFTHKRAIMGYLLKYCEVGYNLNDRLILSYNDNVVLDDADTDIDVIKLTIDKGKVINVEGRY